MEQIFIQDDLLSLTVALKAFQGYKKEAPGWEIANTSDRCFEWSNEHCIFINVIVSVLAF